ncbi:MAG TPA: histidine phosphatase family protein [Gaiellaceae bacterium]|nr:histidine phosphatase family protein [Gaiellaceae bacterium]
MRLRLAAVLLGVLATAAAGPVGAGSRAVDPGLGSAVANGGVVLVMRHAATNWAKADQDPVDLADCRTQRNLSAQGRAQSRAIGAGVRRLNARVGTVLASPFCRTKETARLAFGRYVVSRALLNTVSSEHDAAWRRQIKAARALLGRVPARGTVTALVTHGSVITDATGEVVEEGETLVVRPRGRSRFSVVGRVLASEWRALRAPAKAGALRVREYRVPAGSHPHDVAPAPDGTVWYTAQATGALGRLDPKTGKTTEIPLGDGSAPHGVVVGPDGAAWVTDGGLNAIVRVDAKSGDVTRFPLPSSTGWANLNTATFDRRGVLWFTGQSGIYGRLVPKTGAMRVFRSPGGPGPYGIATTPKGQVWYASLAGSHIAKIELGTGRATIRRPPTRGQGARRVWSDSRGRLWVSEWNAGKVARYDPVTRRWREWRLPGQAQPYAIYVDGKDIVWLTDFSTSDIVRFDPRTQRFTRVRLRAGADVRQLLGRPGEVWGAESGADRLVVVRT